MVPVTTEVQFEVVTTFIDVIDDVVMAMSIPKGVPPENVNVTTEEVPVGLGKLVHEAGLFVSFVHEVVIGSSPLHLMLAVE